MKQSIDHIVILPGSLPVCLSARISQIPKFTKFSVDVACGRGSAIHVIRTLCTSGFVDDVMSPIMGL